MNPSPIGASPRSDAVPQDAKSNPSNGLVERLRRFADACAVAKSQDDEWLGHYLNGDDGDVAADIRELLRAQQEGVLSSQRGENRSALIPLSAQTLSLLRASQDGYWESIVEEVQRACDRVRHASLLNHQAAHILAWANLARDAVTAALAPATPIGGLSLGVEGDQGVSVARSGGTAQAPKSDNHSPTEGEDRCTSK